MTIGLINILGLISTLVGVLMLFRYGMPYHVPSGGAIGLKIRQVDESGLSKEARYRKLGWAGLLLVVVGAALQIFVSYSSMPPW